MKNLHIFILACLCTFFTTQAQIKVNSKTYTPQQLVQNILIGSGCVSNVQVTNSVSGSFSDGEKSYGYFNAGTSNFPFSSGLVLSTGKAIHTEGPNNSILSDDATNWKGDNDLENALGISNTTNATILEFDFTPITNFVSFRYIFASEEYQKNSANTCKYSDAFAFLIKPINSTSYQNIAIIPGTNTPVAVTTVHPKTANDCNAINETYFDTFNDYGNSVPINFNGQTKILTAYTNVNANQKYHIKLVIADEANYQYDSAVFLEAGSFESNVSLGENKLISNKTALCANESITLNATTPNATNYTWYKNEILIPSENNSTYNVTTPGTYKVVVNTANSCDITGNIIVEYYAKDNPNYVAATACEATSNADGFAIFNLNNLKDEITNGISNASVVFFNSQNDVDNNNTITNPENFQNTTPYQQTIIAEVTNLDTGCVSYANTTLNVSQNTITQHGTFYSCDESNNNSLQGFFDLEAIRSQLYTSSTPTHFYKNIDDLNNNTNELSGTLETGDQTIYVRLGDFNHCSGLEKFDLEVEAAPQIDIKNQYILCLNNTNLKITAPIGYQSYEWFKVENGSRKSVSTLRSFYPTEAGEYVLAITAQRNYNSCYAEKSFTVIASNIATFNPEPEIQDISNNNTITVFIEGEGDYQYAINNINGPYQDSNIFENVSAGFTTIYVKDKFGCGISAKEVAVVGYNKFFTPNGDGINDYWQLKGINTLTQPNSLIFIFDRFGKLVKQIRVDSKGWDGMYAGKPLPSSDYWFTVTLNNGRIFKGHFTLKR
ncbi:choice-of-anchor L domain-containing protein [Zhouia sp. PK063]|uniref:choice-of-anchor L domain-containing protein n=1 Tax=Zhouia sp. PK063 TaxID=3373602 RepID=UPI00379BE4D7